MPRLDLAQQTSRRPYDFGDFLRPASSGSISSHGTARSRTRRGSTASRRSQPFTRQSVHSGASAGHRVGGAKSITVDVRIVAATNKALDEPEFRKDLLHRLNAVTIAMPPLRDRPADIPDLARHFLRLSSNPGPVHVTGLRPDAIARLQQHPWPGNVRELKAAIDRAILFAHGPELTPEDLPLERPAVNEIDTSADYDANKISIPAHLSLAQIERHHIQQVLRASEGNISQAAKTLGINRMTLYKRIAAYGGK